MLVAVVLAAGLAACSDSRDGQIQPGDASPIGPVAVSAAPEAEFPVTFEGRYGDVTVKQQPRRVVALGRGDADALLALGVTPIAMTAWEELGNLGTGPWAEDRLESRPTLIPSPQMDADYDQVAEVAKLRPDLIVETGLHDDSERYQGLSKIAPVIAAPRGAGEFYVPTMAEQTLTVARVLGIPQQGQKLLDDLEATRASTVRDHPEFKGAIVSVGQRIETTWFGQIFAIDRLKFFLDLGFRPNPAFQDLASTADTDLGYEPDQVEVPARNLKVFDADLVVVDETNARRPVLEDKNFLAVPAVRDGHVITLSPDPEKPYLQALDRPSVLSQTWLLETLVPEVDGKLG
ncbi:iron-siderophore ABC transporter substrate-binding protein [Kineosporia succinea]